MCFFHTKIMDLKIHCHLPKISLSIEKSPVEAIRSRCTHLSYSYELDRQYIPLYTEIKSYNPLTYIRHPGVLSSFCIRHYPIPTYINLNPNLRRGDVTAPFTLIFTWSPQVYLCTRLVSNVTTPVGCNCTHS